VVLLLLGVCMTIDYADDCIDINSTIKENSTNGLRIEDNTTLVCHNISKSNIVPHKGDKVYIDKSVKTVPTISMWAKPSVRSGYSYTWYKFTWVDYCPNCGHYNALLKNPKGVPEREYTCRYCDSDFCAVTGKEKYSWSRVYLRKA